MHSTAFLLLVAAFAAAPRMKQDSAPASRPQLKTPPATGDLWLAFGKDELNEESGAVSTSVVLMPGSFHRMVTSASLAVPPAAGASAQIEVKLQLASGWTPWIPVLKAEGSPDGTHFSSIRGALPPGVKLDVDVLEVAGGGTCSGFQIRCVHSAGVTVRSLAATMYRSEPQPKRAHLNSAAWGVVLPVPQRSQRTEDPAIASRICAPTSIAMVLDYFGVKRTTAEVAKRCFDAASDLYGNWSADAAAASELLGGSVYAVRAAAFPEIEAEILSGRPVVLSHAWKAGELTGAPIEKSAGHLVVVCGFTDAGDLVVNDPAAPPDQVRRVYKRDEILKTWQENGSGIVYLFRPL